MKKERTGSTTKNCSLTNSMKNYQVQLLYNHQPQIDVVVSRQTLNLKP